MGEGIGGRTVPGCFYVPFDPFFNSADVFLSVLQVVTDVVGLAARYEAIVGRLAGFGVDRPAAVLYTSCEVVGAAVRFGILKVEIFCSSG